MNDLVENGRNLPNGGGNNGGNGNNVPNANDGNNGNNVPNANDGNNGNNGQNNGNNVVPNGGQAPANPPNLGPAPPMNHNLPIPDKFEGANLPNQADLWPKWLKRFERYRSASGLSRQPEQDQINTLMYSMGNSGDDILATLAIDDQQATYNQIIVELNKYFQKRRNVVVERARFNRRSQQPGEPIDTFIQDLYRMSEYCEYGTLKDSLIRDRIVVGVVDDNLSDRLQARDDLTLAKAVEMAQQAESRKQNKPVVRGDAKQQSVNFVQKGQFKNKQFPKKTVKSGKPPPPHTIPSVKEKRCHWCGKEPHSKQACPAKSAKCGKCGKKGHYQSVCLMAMSKVQEVYTQDYPDVPFLGEITSDPGPYLETGEISGSGQFWTAVVTVNDNPTRFKLDSGAAVTVLSDTTPWLDVDKLLSTTQLLKGPGGSDLNVMGSIPVKMTCGGKRIQETVYVLKNQAHSLLSKQSCEKLGLITPHATLVQEVQFQTGPDFKSEFESLFKGLGKLKEPYTIQLRPDARPVCIYTPRKVAHPLLPKVKCEIDKMLEQGVISKVTEPTTWCCAMVPVPKPNGKLRVCVDMTPLNTAVRRSIHPMASVDESLAKLSGGRVFSKLDANSGFWQLPLAEESRLLTTFITPFGRFCFNRLPFGISSAPEIFQRTMTQILLDLEGIVCHMDDVLIYGRNQAEHDTRVRAVLNRIMEAGLTLNEKCEFSKREIRFLGHIVNDQGIQADPEKTRAIERFPEPGNVTELQRFQGMVNQMGKFIPDLATINKPLRDLLKKESQWVWDKPQAEAFTRIKKALASPTVLAHYDVNKYSTVAADASANGIGAVLLQEDNGQRKAVCYASRSLTETEKRYAVIEKEALAATWASEKFSEYILGSEYTLETDHKPLVPLLSTKDLFLMPPRILRFRLRLMRFSPTVVYVAGKFQITADALSRAPVGGPQQADIFLIEDSEAFAQQAVYILPASQQRLLQIKEAQQKDAECIQILDYCKIGWPTYMPNEPILKPYWDNRQHFTVVNDLLMYDDRLVIPCTLRLDILNKIHEGHLGITKCRSAARQSVWWPNLNNSIEDMVQRCSTCVKLQPEKRETLMSSSLPERPWERLGSDLFEINGRTYLLVVDYYSRWIEIRTLERTTSEDITLKLRSIFATHGIPDILISDNGPQYSSEHFRQFCNSYGFTHSTSSPRYPQANGEAERAVRTVKNLLKKNTDPYLALLAYRSAPLANGLSPAQLLMGRRLNTRLPTLPRSLDPKQNDSDSIRQKEALLKDRQSRNYNQHHKAHDLPVLSQGDSVWVRDLQRPGEVVRRMPQPRSYLVSTEKQTVRRNRSALISVPDGNIPVGTPSVPTQKTVNNHVVDHRVTSSPARITPTVSVSIPRVNTPSPVRPKTVGPSPMRPKTVGPVPNSNQMTKDTTPARVVTRSGRPVKPVQRLDL